MRTVDVAVADDCIPEHDAGVLAVLAVEALPSDCTPLRKPLIIFKPMPPKGKPHSQSQAVTGICDKRRIETREVTVFVPRRLANCPPRRRLNIYVQLLSAVAHELVHVADAHRRREFDFSVPYYRRPHECRAYKQGGIASDNVLADPAKIALLYSLIK